MNKIDFRVIGALIGIAILVYINSKIIEFIHTTEKFTLKIIPLVLIWAIDLGFTIIIYKIVKLILNRP